MWGFHISVEAESAFRPPTQAVCKDHRMLEASFSTHGTLDLTCKRWPSPKGQTVQFLEELCPARHGTVSTKAELMDVLSIQEFFGALLHETPAHITRFARIEATHL